MSTEPPLNLYSASGIPALMRDQLLAAGGDDLPIDFRMNFERIRTSISHDFLLDEVSRDEVYQQIHKAYPSLNQKTLDDLKRLEGHFSQRFSERIFSEAADETIHAIPVREKSTFFQLFAGALKAAAAPDPNNLAYRLGSEFAGPVFFGFVHRVLEEAVKDGLKRVYFLARDGHIFYEIAKIIKAEFSYDLDLRYLYVSRKSLRFPSILSLGEEEADWLFEEMDKQLTLACLAGRLGVSAGELRGELEEKGICLPCSEVPLPPELSQRIRQNLMEDRAFSRAVLDRAEKERESVLAYFEQEGVFDKTPCAFVDLGWRGTLQDALYRILLARDPTARVTEYYFGISEFSDQTTLQNQKKPFFMFPSPKPSTGTLLEAILMANHGMTTGYAKDTEGRYQPLLKAAPPGLDEWGYLHYLKGIQCFSENFSRSLAEFQDFVQPQYEMVFPHLMHYMEKAPRWIADAVGNLPYSGDQEESNIRRFAAPYSVGEALRHCFRIRPIPGVGSHWMDATITRSGWLARVILSLDPHRVLPVLAEAFGLRAKIGSLLRRKKHP